MSAVMALSAASIPPRSVTRFDSDSKQIRIDNCASFCISNDKTDFVGPLKSMNRKLKGLGGTLGNIQSGTIRWFIEDDMGRRHRVLIPNSLYVPESPSRLLSPQHWAQEANDVTPNPRGTWCATYRDSIVLQWHQRQFTRTLALDSRGSNVATFYTAPSYNKFQAFCAECDGTSGNEREERMTKTGQKKSKRPSETIVSFVASTVSDDEDEDSKPKSTENPSELEAANRTTERELRDNWPDGHTSPASFEFDQQAPTTAVVEVDTGDGENRNVKNDVLTEFTHVHQRLGHLPPAKIQRMAAAGFLPRRLAKCQVPACRSCLFGQATRRPWRHKPRKDAIPRKLRTATSPGQCVSVDQLESSTPGLIAQMKGWLTKKRYRVATIFVDHFSGLSYVHLQKTTNAAETLEAKRAFERFARRHDIRISQYQADNGRFAETVFLDHVRQSQQTITFCGVNAHFQNAVAERRIRVLQDRARTMLLHAKQRWPTAVEAYLWPYAIRLANEVHNATPDILRHDFKSPLELFTNSVVTPDLGHFRPFACPVYVLDNSMQQGKKIDKWEARSRMGLYLGTSMVHARSVALVLSLSTGHVSPQFHLKFDPHFDTVRSISLPHTAWQRACYFLSSSDSTPATRRARGRKDTTVEQGQQANAADEPSIPEDGMLYDDVLNYDNDIIETIEQDETSADVETTQGVNNAQDGIGLRRSGRRKPGSQLDREGMWVSMEAQLETTAPYHVAFEVCQEPIEEATNEDPIQAYAASADPDTMYYHEAMKAPDKENFKEAMRQEVNSHTENEVWELVPAASVPEGVKVLPSVWAMKRKRKIATREVYKWKARLNVDGSKQEHGINFWDTFSPVASWAAIRLVLIAALINGWQTRQVDFVLAYTQADVECELFMKLPKGFEMNEEGDYVLKLKKNLFGQKQAGRVWNHHLVDKLHSIGFQSSAIDECLFYKGKSVFVLYTDDSILAGPDPKELDEILEQMRTSGLKLTVEGDITDFLGVQIDRIEDGKFRLSQPHLIDDILKELRLEGSKVSTKSTPGASSQPLLRHPTSEPFDGHFDYRRVVGKMNYLEKCSRPDISSAVHQCARFVADPKVEHGKALKWIGRYLAASRDKGIIYSPNNNKGFEVYVDASFCNNWEPETAEWDADTARSRTGYVIMIADCPVTWASKLQAEVALSTTESEYITISTATREVLPMMELIDEMHKKGCLNKKMLPTFHCKVFEDNSGAIYLATGVKHPKMRPRTKHINIKYHHFRNKVMDGTLSIHQVPTQDMLADILTKNCTEAIIQHLRPLIMGW